MGNTATNFENHYQKWRTYCRSDAVALSSSDDAYVNNPHFQAMVDMGEDAVPYIMQKLRTDEDAHFLIHALERITNKRFTPEEIEEAKVRYGTPLGNQGYAAMWLDWWNQQQLGKDGKQ
jgi:hypothetical protein